MKYKLGRTFSLGSSSDGNAFYLELHREKYDKPFRLLIECGFSIAELRKRLLKKGVGLADVDAVLVTHEHLDHAKAVADLMKRGKDVFAPKSVYEKFGLKVNERHIIRERIAKNIADGIKVYGFPLDHENDDGTLTYTLGYMIVVEDTFRILFVTDTKYVKWDLSKFQFNVIFIEANNDKRTLYYALRDAERNNNRAMQIHITRVLKSHMTVENTAKTLASLDLRKCDNIYLIHLSANTKINPYDFKSTVRQEIKSKLRRVVYKTKTGSVAQVMRPRIIVVKKNGEMT
ncbi:MAG: MBL fold metallo-hydrolase [Bacteroidia bacterium]|nr:MBL fold metallo-hydrolase [Bacteroidia bacterium]